MSATFGDHVRIRATPETERVGVAGLHGYVFGETTPSSSGVAVIGTVTADYAVNVHFEESGRTLWFVPELVELIDHAPGTAIRLQGVDKHWTRTADGSWIEESTAGDAPTSGRTRKPWWRLW